MCDYLFRMRTILIAALVSFSGTAIGEDCRYVSGFDYGSVTFLDDETAIDFEGALCKINWGDESGHEMACDSGETRQFTLQSGTLGGEGLDLLVLLDHVWYRQCQ